MAEARSGWLKQARVRLRTAVARVKRRVGMGGVVLCERAARLVRTRLSELQLLGGFRRPVFVLKHYGPWWATHEREPCAPPEGVGGSSDGDPVIRAAIVPTTHNPSCRCSRDSRSMSPTTNRHDKLILTSGGLNARWCGIRMPKHELDKPGRRLGKARAAGEGYSDVNSAESKWPVGVII